MYMSGNINVIKNRNTLFTIDSEVFFSLFDNTIVRRRNKFFDAVSRGSIVYDDFIELSRKGEVPYPLFLLQKQYVDKIVEDFRKKVYFGVSKDQLSISSRGDITLADISLILKDITRKQNYFKKHITKSNDVAKKYTQSKMSISEKAEEIRDIIGYDINNIFQLNKEESFNTLDNGLSAHCVYISLYAHNYSPQTIEKSLQFSGIAINDKKCPFLFIKAGDNDSRIEPWGRRLFTAALLLSCLLHGDCRPVTMDGNCKELINDKHYLFAEEFLMPESIFKKEICESITDTYLIATKYSVSPAAVVMRLFRLGIICDDAKVEYLNELSDKWCKLTSKKGGGQGISLEKGINRYNNRAVVDFIVREYKSKKINLYEARNLLCYKKGDKFNIEALQHD